MEIRKTNRNLMADGELNPYYEFQQRALDSIFPNQNVFRPKEHAEGTDPNTVLLFDKATGIQVWSFQNTDKDGNFNLEFANKGKIDLRGLKSEADLPAIKGALIMDVAQTIQTAEALSMGGFLALGEANETYNTANCLEMQGMKLRWGTPVIGKFNFYGNDRATIVSGNASPLSPYPEDGIKTDCADFILPPATDETFPDYAKLAMLIRLWNTPQESKTRLVGEEMPWYLERFGTCGIHLVSDMQSAIEKLNGRILLWT